jgi:hypothetical protein
MLNILIILFTGTLFLTDKFALERENKKIRIQIDDLMEQLDRKSQQTSAMANSDVKNLQSELTSRNKVRFKFILL